MKESEEIISREINGLEIKCEAGCSWCCHQLIIVTCAADGETILETVKARLSESEFEAFSRMIREQAGAISKLPHTEAEKHRWPCPMLKDGKCIVYDVRPVACRSVFSTDEECCRAMLHARTFNDLPVPYRRMAMAISEKAIRIQILVNNRRPIDGPVEIRSLLLSLLEKNNG